MNRPVRATPRALDVLLETFDWTLASRSEYRPIEVWTNSRFPEEEIVIPTDPERGDYSALAQRALDSIQALHGSSAVSILTLFQSGGNQRVESTKWQKETSGRGIIGWTAGEDLILSARESLAAAAKASREKRKYFGNTASYVSRKFLEATYMGQTEPGSFIVTAHVPADQQFFFTEKMERESKDTLLSTGAEASTGSQIVSMLTHTLSATRSTLDEVLKKKSASIDRKVEAFEEIVPDGFSFEISRSLSRLSASSEGAVRIIRTASTFEDDPERPRDSEFVFSPADASVLESVAASFALTRDPEEMLIQGEVTLLDHVSSSKERIVRVHVRNRSDINIVRLRLNADQYRVAIDAHRNDYQVSATGVVEKEGRVLWMYRPQAFQVVPEITY